MGRIERGECGPVLATCSECGEQFRESHMDSHAAWHVQCRSQKHVWAFMDLYRAEKKQIETELGHRITDFYGD
jgi:hypothetical protein